MFLTRDGRELDYHFLLWQFDNKLPEVQRRELVRIDKGALKSSINKEDCSEDSVDDDELQKVLNRNNTTQCCALF